ncbi:nitrous oxide reductase accessory protein NosL [Bacillus tianshenii]|nr:nitrous oxide reductase accessory protein NosL [Bacillus tianshenii]
MQGKVLVGTALVIALLTGCAQQNTEEAAPQTEQNEPTNSQLTIAETDNEQQIAIQPQEPAEDEKCAFCNMKVYQKDEEMGAFTAQMVTKDGEHLFFDDSGCLLNYSRKTGEEPQISWVRDHDTLEWVKLEEATLVKADLKTPMKYEIAFFASKENADKFLADNPEKNGEIIMLDALDTEAEQRMKKKMEMMKEKNEGMESEGHEGHMHE